MGGDVLAARGERTGETQYLMSLVHFSPGKRLNSRLFQAWAFEQAAGK